MAYIQNRGDGFERANNIANRRGNPCGCPWDGGGRKGGRKAQPHDIRFAGVFLRFCNALSLMKLSAPRAG